MEEVFKPRGAWDTFLGNPPASAGFGVASWWDSGKFGNTRVADIGTAPVLPSWGGPAVYGDITLKPEYGGGAITQAQAKRAAELSKNPANGQLPGESDADYIKRLIGWAKNGRGRTFKEQDAREREDRLAADARYRAENPPRMNVPSGWRPGMTPEEEQEWEREQAERREQLEHFLHGVNDLLEKIPEAGETNEVPVGGR